MSLYTIYTISFSPSLFFKIIVKYNLKFIILMICNYTSQWMELSTFQLLGNQYHHSFSFNICI